MISLEDIVKAQRRDTTPFKVAVVITCYNQELYIAKALDSVLSQKTSFPYKIMISDDASKDRSREILKQYEQRYPDKVEVLYHDENQGTNKNRNDVLCICDTPYIAFLDGDDYWCDDHQLERKYKFLEQNVNYIGYFTAGGRENNLSANDFTEHGVCDSFNDKHALKNEYPGMYCGFFIRNIYKYMDKRDLKTYLSYAIDESSKLPIMVGIIGDVYRGESTTTWIYRSVQGSLSSRESEQNGCKEYFKSRMNMKNMVFELFGLSMELDEQIEELLYQSFVTAVRKRTDKDKEQFHYICQHCHYTKAQISKIILYRLVRKVFKKT